MKTTEQLIQISNDAYRQIFERIMYDGKYNSGQLASVVAMIFQLSFATVERDAGLEVARQSFHYAVDYMIDKMIDGVQEHQNKLIDEQSN